MKRSFGMLLFALVVSATNANAQEVREWVACPTLPEAQGIVDLFRDADAKGESFDAFAEKVQGVLNHGSCKESSGSAEWLSAVAQPHQWEARLNGGPALALYVAERLERGETKYFAVSRMFVGRSK
ncbi:MAG: hypothetical protein A2948_06045 [Candidatus Lloydbacteria bacterium RIFCSPLOWO2_01_FULL_54_18]|nr:MAG: hypothetical protein A2948_06045 [Candidatus Lloydbacteria bacterium RIFCSPLOWO2_01_FULL_54_18]